MAGVCVHCTCHYKAGQMVESRSINGVLCLSHPPESGNDCEKLLCDCDKAAIECFVNTHINSSVKGMDIAFCPAPVTGTNYTVLTSETSEPPRDAGGR